MKESIDEEHSRDTAATSKSARKTAKKEDKRDSFSFSQRQKHQKEAATTGKAVVKKHELPAEVGFSLIEVFFHEIFGWF